MISNNRSNGYRVVVNRLIKFKLKGFFEAVVSINSNRWSSKITKGFGTEQ